MSLKDHFFAIKPQPEVVEMDGDKYVVHPITGYELAECYKRAGKDENKLGFCVLIFCVKDEAGHRVFTDDDLDALAGMPHFAVSPLLAASNKVNKFGVDDAKKN